MRPVSSRTRSSVVSGSTRSISKCVTASRGSSVSVEMTVRCAAVAAQRRVDRAAATRRATLDQREVLARDGAALQSGLERTMDVLAARDDEKPRRVAIESMNDARALGPSPPATRPASACTSVPVEWPRAGCTTTPAGLSTTSRCSSSQATVKGAGCSSATGAARRLALVDADDLARGEPVALGNGAAVDRDGAGVDEALRAAARAERPGQERVQALTRAFRLDQELHRSPGARRLRPRGWRDLRASHRARSR